MDIVLNVLSDWVLLVLLVDIKDDIEYFVDEYGIDTFVNEGDDVWLFSVCIEEDKNGICVVEWGVGDVDWLKVTEDVVVEDADAAAAADVDPPGSACVVRGFVIESMSVYCLTGVVFKLDDGGVDSETCVLKFRKQNINKTQEL